MTCKDLEHLTSLLAAGAVPDQGSSPACPDELEIAGYVDGTLGASACEPLERHLADCSHCLALVALLSRERDTEARETVPAAVVAPARAPVTTRPTRRWLSAPQWAAAAALVLAVPLLLELGRGPDRGVEGQGRPDAPATRNLGSGTAALQVLAPLPGTVVDGRRLAFRWEAVPGSPYYDVRVVTDAGDVVIRERVTGTTWRPPVGLQLQPGAEYFVHVDAYPSGDKAVSSDHVPFRVAN